MINNQIFKYQKQINQICQSDGISYLALFGSQARNEAKVNSDIDLLIKYKHPVGLFKLFDSQERFEKLFHKKIDLVTVNGLKKQLIPYIKQDITVLYENS